MFRKIARKFQTFTFSSPKTRHQWPTIKAPEIIKPAYLIVKEISDLKWICKHPNVNNTWEDATITYLNTWYWTGIWFRQLCGNKCMTLYPKSVLDQCYVPRMILSVSVEVPKFQVDLSDIVRFQGVRRAHLENRRGRRHFRRRLFRTQTHFV